MLSDSLWQEAVAVSQMPELRHRQAGEMALKRTNVNNIQTKQRTNEITKNGRISYVPSRIRI